jgi:hypothetical protein
MSYEPTLIIRRSSLEIQRKEIVYVIDSDKKITKEVMAAYKVLYGILQWEETHFVKFPEIELAIIQPEFTTFNATVRKLLHDLNIDFKVNY